MIKLYKFRLKVSEYSKHSNISKRANYGKEYPLSGSVNNSVLVLAPLRLIYLKMRVYIRNFPTVLFARKIMKRHPQV